MRYHALCGARSLCAAVLLAALAVLPGFAAFAQTADSGTADGKAAPAPQPAQKVDQYAEIQRAVAGPAGSPECVWLGRRAVSLLWRDDIDTAFRHLDLYDRFGCPGGRIQATFRCLILNESSIDPKAPDSLNDRIEACWINPTQPAPPPTAAAAPNQTSNR
jgi:hypothetical protein